MIEISQTPTATGPTVKDKFAEMSAHAELSAQQLRTLRDFLEDYYTVFGGNWVALMQAVFDHCAEEEYKAALWKRDSLRKTKEIDAMPEQHRDKCC